MRAPPPLKARRGRAADRRECAGTIALVGNPNVGKSTLFNGLTGLHQHTGNWAGKTVANARGTCLHRGRSYTLVDLPGAYSLTPNSAEEEVTRDFLCYGEADAVIVVADATALERNLNLALQTAEVCPRVILGINLLDEAEKKGIAIDLKDLSRELALPVVPLVARQGQGFGDLMDQVAAALTASRRPKAPRVNYAPPLEEAIARLTPLLDRGDLPFGSRWGALALLTEGEDFLDRGAKFGLGALREDPALREAVRAEGERLGSLGLTREALKDHIATARVGRGETLARRVVRAAGPSRPDRDRRLDRLCTSKATGIPLMLLVLTLIFWLTLAGASYPSQALAAAFQWLGAKLLAGAVAIGVPALIYEPLVNGVYAVLTWVIAVMLPPMAIFFPLFTLLEDVGYLPRVAFNLDRQFQKAAACGKQALTMAMGFGCNAAAVVGCRIIDSPRERLLATITNSLVPCNGRFPTLVALISMFFVLGAAGFAGSLLAAALLTGAILLGVAMTLVSTRLLSKTLLKGVPSSFILELPPFRRPQVGQVILRSLLDRTLFVLGRAVVVAAPAGLVIWALANLTWGDSTLLARCAAALDPLGRFLGLDGPILIGFILGFPANEIVLPLVLMTYLAEGALVEMGSLASLQELLLAQGWTWVTALCFLVFTLFHWPCSTTCLTIAKETRSWGWTGLSFLLPTAIGMTLCALIAAISHLF